MSRRTRLALLFALAIAVAFAVVVQAVTWWAFRVTGNP